MMDKIALILVIVGALNWGGIGIFGFDTVAFLFGGQTAVLSRIIYALVGLAGLWCITLLFRDTEHGTRPSSHGLSTLEKRAPVGALFYLSELHSLNGLHVRCNIHRAVRGVDHHARPAARRFFYIFHLRAVHRTLAPPCACE